jgi:tRNA/rRNA methyltransferase
MLKARTKNISIVLYKPKYAGNIGSVVRAAKNMGIENIIVVGTNDFDREEMQQRSTHLAADVLDKIKYVQGVEEALGGFNYIVGTTARGRTGYCRYLSEKQGRPAFRSGRYRSRQ